MASLGITLNQSELPEGQNFDPIPEGWYTAQIKAAELKNTKANDGQYIAVQYTVTGPTHAGRVIFGNLNIKNRNSEAERIGMGQLGSVMGAIGLAKIEDTDQLIGGNLQIKVGMSKPQEGYEQRNEVKGWKAIEGGPAPMPAVGAVGAVAKPATVPASTKAPWQK
jgi:hypothetical protein